MLECKTTNLYCPTYVTIKYSKSPWFWRLPSIYYLCTATWFIGLHKRNWNETSPGTGPFGFHFYRTSVAELCGGFPSDHRLLYLKRVCGRGTKAGTWAAAPLSPAEATEAIATSRPLDTRYRKLKAIGLVSFTCINYALGAPPFASNSNTVSLSNSARKNKFMLHSLKHAVLNFVLMKMLNNR